MTVSKTARFVELSRKRKLALIEAAALLMAAWAATRFLPYAWWTRLLGPAGTVQQAIRPQAGTPVSKIVSWAVRTAARQFPWQVTCLPQAIAGRWMLARRDVDSTLCIGVRSARTAGGQGAQMHAWLAIEDWVSEERGAGDDYRIIARFTTT
ncbi:MAG: lasso peptide biosynthesis B2 protein [Rhizobiales bacterium]|nr:lasso peptide biosynthesis B2 protein [Hyphomicrobiales bacterium]